jgi:hypothetical protein
MNKEWEYAGLLIDSFNIDVKRVVADARFGDSYPGQWVAHMEKERIGKPTFTISAWGDTACDAVINVYNKSHHATPVNQYKGQKVYIEPEKHYWVIRHYLPTTKQHRKVFNSYRSESAALSAAKQHELEVVQWMQ